MKRLNITLSILMIFFVSTVFAQKDNVEVKNEQREVGAFHSLDINGRFVVELYYSETPEVSVKAASKYIDAIGTKVENGMLIINMLDAIGDENISLLDGVIMKYKDYLIRKPIEIRIGVNELNIINLGGATNLTADKTIDTNSLHLSFGDAAKASLTTNASSIEATLTGASKLEIKGSTIDLKLNVHGASSVMAAKLKAENLTIEQTGASRAETYASESLDATLSGATKLSCSGSPKNIKQRVSMGSSIEIK